MGASGMDPRCFQPYVGGHGPGFCIDRRPPGNEDAPQEMARGGNIPAETPPQEIGESQPTKSVAIDDLHLVDPKQIVSAIVDYTITDSWCEQDGSRVMLRLEGKELPPITLTLDPMATWVQGDGTSPWIVALIDP